MGTGPGDESMTRRGLLGAALPAVVGWAAEMIFFRWKTRPWCLFFHIFRPKIFTPKTLWGKSVTQFDLCIFFVGGWFNHQPEVFL